MTASLIQRRRTAGKRAVAGALLFIASVTVTIVSIVYVRSIVMGYDNEVAACRGESASDLVSMIVPGGSLEHRQSVAPCAEAMRERYAPLKIALPPDYAKAQLVAQLLSFAFACVAVGATVIGPLTFGVPAAIGLWRAHRASARERLMMLRGVNTGNELAVAITVDLIARSDLLTKVQDLIGELISLRFSDLPGSRARTCRTGFVARRLAWGRWDEASINRLAQGLNCESEQPGPFAHRRERRAVARIIAGRLAGLAREVNRLPA